MMASNFEGFQGSATGIKYLQDMASSLQVSLGLSVEAPLRRETVSMVVAQRSKREALYGVQRGMVVDAEHYHSAHKTLGPTGDQAAAFDGRVKTHAICTC